MDPQFAQVLVLVIQAATVLAIIVIGVKLFRVLNLAERWFSQQDMPKIEPPTPRIVDPEKNPEWLK